MDKEKRAYKEGKKSAIDAVIASRARHLADNESKNDNNSEIEKEKNKFIAKKLGAEKIENLVKTVKNADESNDRISIDISDDKGFTKSITADFDEKDGHMSLHVIKGSNKVLDVNRTGRKKSTGYGENNKFIEINTKKDIKELALEKYKKEKKKVGLKEDLGYLFKDAFLNTNQLRESEFSDDLKNMYGEKFDLQKRVMIDMAPEKLPEISDIIEDVKDIVYGFISKKDGCRIVNRSWIHNCENLSDYYDVQLNPEITIKEKIGICTDQCLAIKHLFEKKHSDYKTQMYALMKGRFGHCVIGFMTPKNEWYYLENAWDKQRGLHGPFLSQDELEKYFNNVYYNAHKDDNDDDVVVMTYENYRNSSLNESFIILPIFI